MHICLCKVRWTFFSVKFTQSSVILYSQWWFAQIYGENPFYQKCVCAGHQSEAEKENWNAHCITMATPNQKHFSYYICHWIVFVFWAIVMVSLFVCSTNWFLNKNFASLSINCGHWDYDASGCAATAIDPNREISVGQWTRNNQQRTSQFIRLFIHPFKLRIYTLYTC